MELSSPKLKKLLIIQEGTFKSKTKKISYFLRLSADKFIHSSSYYSPSDLLQ